MSRIFRGLKRVLRFLALTLLAAALSVGIVAAVVLRWPNLFIHDNVLRWGAELLGTKGIGVGWSSLSVDIQSVQWLTKRIEIRGRNFCVDLASEGVSGCIGELRVQGVLSLENFRLRIVELGPVSLLKGWVKVRPEIKESENQVASKGKRGFVFPLGLDHARILPIRIELERWDVELGATRLTGKLDLDSTSLNRDAQVRVKLDGEWTESGQPALAVSDLELRLSNPNGFLDLNGWKIRSKAVGRLSGDERFRFDADLKPRLETEDSPEVSFRVDGNYRKGRFAVGGRVFGLASPNRASIRIRAEANRLSSAVTRIQTSDCALNLARVAREGEESRLRLECPVTASVAIPPGLARFHIPGEVGANVRADLRLSSFLPGAKTRLAGVVDAPLRPILSPLFEGRGGVRGQVDGVIGSLPKADLLEAQVALELRVPRFQQLVSELDGTPFSVPAPFRVLKGAGSLRVHGTVNLEEGEAPIVLRTRLGSKSQRLDLDSESVARVQAPLSHPEGKLALAVTLSDVKLELPRLALEEPPRLLPDPRIRSFSQRQVEPSAPDERPRFTYELDVATPPGHPVLLLSNLARAPVPVEVNLHTGTGIPPTGTIRVGSFPVEFFRREAEVKYFRLGLLAPSDSSSLDGLVRLAYADYTVDVSLIGTLGKPRLKLTSDPPLPEEQLYAVLLFGRPLDELDPDQTSSVANTRAAVTEGAIGLASLYLLASTPIQSVGYDPTTGQISAKVRLAEGTSLTVGADPKQLSTVGIRKRLGARWSVTTEVTNPSEQSDRTISALVEWYYRY